MSKKFAAIGTAPGAAPELKQQAAQVETKLENIPGLEGLLAKVTNTEQAAALLIQMAEKLGGPTKLAPAVVLKKAVAMVGKAAAAPAGNLQESFNSVNDFVGYLFESTTENE